MLESLIKNDSSDDQRRSVRYEIPNLVAHYWTGFAQADSPVRNISADGMYIYADVPLYPGTAITMTLQKKTGEEYEEWITVQAMVVYRDPKGMGVRFAFPEKVSQPDSSLAGRKSFEKFMRILTGEE